ncbi:MAG: hypothetical protein HY810_04410 [Candidatus Omnitrophica bacterium]|nr:hypothetical protein [Candidatus Omnitrophota bacterium]
MDKFPNIRTVLGVIMLSIGIFIALWVFQFIFNFLNSQSSIKILDCIMSLESIERTIKTSSQIIELPNALFLLFRYGVLMFLLGISTALAVVFIKSGTYLVQPDYKQVLETIMRQVKEIKDKISS